MSNRINGTVKWFSEQKGYGFISNDDDNDYFAHISEIKDTNVKTLGAGEEVSFETEESLKGTKAINIELVK